MSVESPRKPESKDSTKGQKFQGTIPPLDFSFMNLTTFEDCLHEEPRKSPKKQKTTSKDGKSLSKSLKLCNNNVADCSTLCSTIDQLMAEPNELAWLDLSSNDLTTIDEVLLCYKNLQILYLHGNHIQDIKQVDKLAQMTSLRKLSLHGNPIEQIKHYRLYVLDKLPQLRELDFSMVTKAERTTADTIQKMTTPQTRKVKKQDDD